MSDKRLVIVTGSSRGIGAAVCRKLAALGYPVAVNYAASEDAAQALVREIEGKGGRAACFAGDMAHEADVVALFEQACSQLGPLGGVVVNAGITGPICRVEDIKPAILERVLAVNVTGAFLTAREAVRRMSTKHGGSGGSIVILSSRAAGLGGPGEFVHYAASKGAMDSLNIGLAKEVAEEGIRVNAVSPGLIDTEIHASAGAPDRVARLQSAIPVKRGGSAEEVAEAIAWLLSPAASYVTASNLHVAGGR